MFDVGQAALGLSIDGVMKALQGVNRGNFGQTPFTQSFGGDGCVQYFKTSDISRFQIRAHSTCLLFLTKSMRGQVMTDATL